jgi:hypothetical protein
MDKNREAVNKYYWDAYIIIFTPTFINNMCEGRWLYLVEIEKVEEQIGEALGLEIAAQKAVEELSSKGPLDKRGIKGKLQAMKSSVA